MSEIKVASQFDPFGCALDQRTLIEASAGTGKTWNICGLYLRLLLEKNLTVKQILVVTFTKAATAELRDRIRTRLVEMLDYVRRGRGTDPFLIKLGEHVDNLGLAPDKVASQLDLALQSFDEASIFTIHAFCQRALAETPFAAGMPFAAELTQDDSEQLTDVVNDFWRKRIASAELSPEIANYLVERNDRPEKLLGLLRRHIAKPKASTIWPIPEAGAEDAQAKLVQLFNEARATWEAQSPAVKKLLCEAVADFKASHKPEKLELAFTECEGYFGAASAAACSTNMKLLAACKLRDGMKVGRSAPAHVFFDQVECLLNQVPALIKQVEADLECARFAMLRDLLELGPEAARKAKREKRLTSYDDLLYNLFEALNNPDYPWLADSLRERFPVALIDEFQDTDPLQFDIFSKIYGTKEDASLFLVGDPKQAIYSFRNADLHTYLSAKDKVSASYTLAANQRSSPGLIKAMNALFQRNPNAFMLPGLDYHEVKVGDKPRANFVDKSGSEADLQIWTLPSESDKAIDRNLAFSYATRGTAAEIARLIQQGQLGHITIDGHPLVPGDIAVLVRSHRQAAMIRDALARLNVASIEISQESVFASEDAADVEALLAAILEPARTGILLAALATSFFGHSASEVCAIEEDESRLRTWADRFLDYRELWQRRGIGFMYRKFLATEGVSGRMLCRQDGERRMTNLRHLGELLEQVGQQYADPESSLRWLQNQRRNGQADDASQLRLESDQDLVQILTIHKSKGLEYPIVFCPYLFDAFVRQPSGAPEGREYHDENGALVIDFRTDADAVSAAKKAMQREECAETLRLIYVALTRAAHRCYFVAGPYTRKVFSNVSCSESCRGMLNWIAAGGECTVDDWLQAARTTDMIGDAWSAYAEQAAPHVQLSPLTDRLARPALPQPPAPSILQALESAGPVNEAWRLGSFSQLVRHFAGESAAMDHDAEADVRRKVSAPSPEIPHSDILLFPRGADAGNCLHAVFEQIDFTDPTGWDRAIERALRRFPTSAGPDLAVKQTMVRNMVKDVVTTPLGNGLTLSSVPLSRRLTELEFSFPAPGLAPSELNAVLARHGYRMPSLSFPALQGFLRGFVDLIFESGGRYYILDWKSNHLGYATADYAADGMAQSMAEHAYHLQYLLYTLALHRYLALRLPGYRYQDHFGGVLYLFVRGVRPGWTHEGQQAGVYRHLPSAACVDELQSLFTSAEEQEAA
ncbi:MAG: recB [Herminiimonas sp.]|nr:recB [Herminiimonas sp.]